ncbi:DUF397 domain-containing protein [Nonomuraea sp. NN258]|uniref:DUF397 domain-containing protein n=1 Tax=Nonomuraea antri TaxID=2730852 RepID=UPI001568FAC0|nr:DUF397 domain-containing protein [Nonomuraea antri]NRQ35615.1 DUF397 domain-containing protein [Nonomuraea antri]
MDQLTQELRTATWVKSSHSGSNGGNCVEIAELTCGRRGIRDSKNPNGPILVFTLSEWDAFINGVKGGEFD